MLDSTPALGATVGVPDADVEAAAEDDKAEEEEEVADDDWDELVRLAHGVEKTEDTDMTATALIKAVAPIRILCCDG